MGLLSYGEVHGGATEIVLLSKEVSLYLWTPSVVLEPVDSERSLPL